jgi:hypothetical protein
MKIYNYSDKPVVINGVSRDEHILHLHSAIPTGNVNHDGKSFLPSTTDDRNIIFTITNSTDGYSYREDEFSVPDVWTWITIFLTFFSFYFVVRILQKIKLS